MNIVDSGAKGAGGEANLTFFQPDVVAPSGGVDASGAEPVVDAADALGATAATVSTQATMTTTQAQAQAGGSSSSISGGVMIGTST